MEDEAVGERNRRADRAREQPLHARLGEVERERDRGDAREEPAIAPERRELDLDLPPNPRALGQEPDESRTRPPADGEREPPADHRRRERRGEPVGGERDEHRRAEAGQDREPAHPVEQHGVERQRRPPPAPEIQRAHDVTPERRDPEQVEEHADEVEARVLAERPVEADGAPEQRPLERRKELAGDVEPDREREPADPDAREGPPDLAAIDVLGEIGEEAGGDGDPENPPCRLRTLAHRGILPAGRGACNFRPLRHLATSGSLTSSVRPG